MAEHNHAVTTPEQVKTDTWMVVRDSTGFHGNLEVIGEVKVPRYSQPTEDGVELSLEKRLSLAVARAVECDDSFISALHDPFVECDDVSTIEGEQFGVVTELGRPIDWVEYEQNPAHKGVWEPEGGI